MRTVFLLLFAILFVALPMPFFAQQQDPAKIGRINQAAGLPLLPSSGEWSGKEFEKCLMPYNLSFQGDRARRNVFLRNRKIFNVSATELLMICDEEDHVTQIDIVYSNKGDSARSKFLNSDIRKSGASLRQLLKSILGSPRNEKFGPAGLQNDVLAWTCGNVRLLLESRRREYTILHICYQKASSKKPGRKELQIHKEKFVDNVRTNGFGDIFLENIPMANQGGKGYCVPATFERVLRYFGISNVNMHQLADAANTGRGGGTTFESMNNSILQLRRRYGLKIHSCGEIKIATLKKYIGQGIPVMWGMNINPPFLQLMSASRKNRPRDKSPKQWLQSIKKYKLPQQGDGHMCLIVGFNEETGEIAVSNSWGESENVPAWVPLKLAARVSMKTTFVLIPEK